MEDEALLQPARNDHAVHMDAGNTVRRRNADGPASPDRQQRHLPSWARRVQTVDMFSKIDAAQRSQVSSSTAAGGIVSILCYITMLVLFFSELSGFLFASRSEHLKVDTSRLQTIEIDFHLTFPAICCADVHVDSMDVTGEQQVNVVQSIFKQRLDSDGYKIGREFIDKDASPKLYIQMPGYGLMSLVGSDHRVNEQRSGAEGCSFRGSLLVNKVEGNFHIAIGRSHKSQGHHIHNFRMSDIPFFNTSHTIHYVNFGPRYSGQAQNSLSSWTRLVPAPTDEDELRSGLFQYHIELTPTTYVSSFGRTVQTNQVSVRDFYRQLTFSGPDKIVGMPGVFFQYKFSPFMLAIDDQRTSIVSFFTNLCAIIGGVFAVSSMIDTTIHRFRRKSSISGYSTLI